MTQIELLEDLLNKAIINFNKKNRKKKFSDLIVANIDTIVESIDKNKSLVSALVTSLLKKIVDPSQDIRLHRTDFEGGYSARSLDIDITTPFFKKHFPKYANKESGFLSMATRTQIPWTKEDGSRIRTRASSEFMHSFLEIFDAIESKIINPKEALLYFFEKLYTLSLQQKMIFDGTIETSDYIHIININSVLQMLEKHFSIDERGTSRLPVIAIYSIYQQLFVQVKRYQNKILRPLNVHTSSDKHGYGDIEIWNEDNTPFEIIEIKHNILIDRNLIFDIVKKCEKTKIERYYILTTAKNNFSSPEEEDFINKFILKIQKDTELYIIANGIFLSLKYYLRFIDDYKGFIKSYTLNLVNDSKNSTEIKESHISAWKRILEEYEVKTI